MQRNKLMGVVALLLCIGMMIPSVSAQAADDDLQRKDRR